MYSVNGGQIFDGIKDGILNGLKSIINAIIKGINKVISIPFKGINSALSRIKSIDIFGLKPFDWIKTLSIPQIPQLAKGNVAYSPLVAQFGEYTGANQNPEITAPQSILKDTFDEVLSRHETGNGNNNKPMYVSIYVGKEKIGDILLEDLREMKRQTGKNLEALVGG